MFEQRSCEFERFSQSSASFLSEAGTVLIFFCFVFLYQDKKMKIHKTQPHETDTIKIIITLCV